MKFYITPDKREICEKKLDKMFKNFSTKPVVTYSEVHKVLKQTVIDWGWDGVERHKMWLDAVEVSVEGIQFNEWVLVATVFYHEDVVAMVDSSLFKDMPSKFGLQYDRCDYCGGIHKSRKESHVLYNKVTGEWMQVGSSCVNKMIDNGKYLANITLKLFEFFKCVGGCDEFEWRGGAWTPASNYWRKAIHYGLAISIAAAYIDEKGDVWTKSGYDYDRHIRISGTNDWLQDYALDYKGGVDEGLVSKVVAYVGTMEGGVDYNGEPNFEQRMKDMVANEYITLGDFYLAFFALTGYRKSIESADFISVLEGKGVKKDAKISFEGEFVTSECYEGFYGRQYSVTFKGTDGLTYKKDVSDLSVISPYKCADGLYRFNAVVKFVAKKNQYIGLGGRLSKFKRVS